MERSITLVILCFVALDGFAFDPKDHIKLLDESKVGNYHHDIKDHWADIEGGLEVVDDPGYNNDAANEMFALLGIPNQQFSIERRIDDLEGIDELIKRALGFGIDRVKWHLAPKYQHIHYLRDYPLFKLRSAKQSCQSANKFIKRAYSAGVQKYREENKLSSFHLYGMEWHCMQFRTRSRRYTPQEEVGT